MDCSRGLGRGMDHRMEDQIEGDLGGGREAVRLFKLFYFRRGAWKVARRGNERWCEGRSGGWYGMTHRGGLGTERGMGDRMEVE